MAIFYGGFIFIVGQCVVSLKMLFIHVMPEAYGK